MNIRCTKRIAVGVLLSALTGCGPSFDVRRGFVTLTLDDPAGGVPHLRWGTLDGRPAALCYATSAGRRVTAKWIVVRLLPDSHADSKYIRAGLFADSGQRGAHGIAALQYDAPVATTASIQGSLIGDQSMVEEWVRRPSAMLRLLLPGPAQEPEGLPKSRHALQAETIAGPDASMRYLWVSDLQGGAIWLRITQSSGTLHVNGFASGVWPSQSPISLRLGWIWLSSVAEDHGDRPDPAGYLRLTSALEAATARNTGFRDPVVRDDLAAMARAMSHVSSWADVFGAERSHSRSR